MTRMTMRSMMMTTMSRRCVASVTIGDCVGDVTTMIFVVLMRVWKINIKF